jgi:hypothetical protein
MEESKQYLENPDETINGYKFIEKYVRVAGTRNRIKDIVPFAKKDNIWLEFEREPNNSYDKNAIKLIGCSKGFLSNKRYFLGYVPKEISVALVNSNLVQQTLPRLRRIWIPDEEDDATIIIQIFIKEEYQENYTCKYDSHRGN